MNGALKKLAKALLLLAVFTSTHAADIVLKDTDGKNIPFSSLKGKWVFINFWAGWCETCIEEIPELNRFYQSHKKDPIALFAVNYDSLSLFEQNNLVRRLNIAYPSLLNNPAEALNLGDIRGVPVTFIYNPEGKLVNALYGGQTAKSLNAAMKS